jgi:tetratricopeptide (TPR) repeat protein
METAARETRAHVRFARGDAEGAFEDWEQGLALARAMGSPERLIPALLDLGHALALLGRLDEARAYVLEGMNVARANPALGDMLRMIAGETDKLGVTPDVDDILSHAPDGPWKDVGLAELHGEGTRAADMCRRMGAPALEADVRMAAAEALLDDGRTAEGLAELERALAFYRSVGATFFLERGESLLREAKSA